MSGAGAAFHLAALLQEDLPETREHIRHEVWSLVFRREQDEVGEALNQHGGYLPQVGVAALQALLHELIDVTMQALGHLAFPSLSRLFQLLIVSADILNISQISSVIAQAALI